MKNTHKSKKLHLDEQRKKEITIIGAGNGGRAFAVYLSQKGHHVNLIFRNPNKIKKIWLTQKIESSSSISRFTGKFQVDTVTPLINKVIPYSDIILIVVPASVHASIIKKISFYLKEGQIILLNPGRTWGAIEAQKLLSYLRPDIKVYVGETQTLLFTCRKIADRGVEIIKVKNKVNYCFYPESDNYLVKNQIENLFPQLELYDNIFYTSLNNVGAMIHPAATLLNSGSICRNQVFKFYYEGITPHIAHTIECVDKERIKIMKTLDVDSITLLDWFEQVYGIREKNYYDAFHTNKSYKNIESPNSLDKRYLTEDIPTGLVPMISIAEYLNLDVPVMKSLVSLANVALNRDFYQIGRTLENIDFPLEIIPNIEAKKEIFSYL